MFKALYLVRHGRTEANRDLRLAGQSDSPLLPRSLEVSAEIGRVLAPSAFDAVYLSPMARVQHSYAAMALPKVKQAVTLESLREISFGQYEGLSRAELPEDFVARRKIGEYTTQFPGGESVEMLEARLLPFIEELRNGHDGQTLCVVAHSWVISIIVGKLLGWSFRQIADFSIPNNFIYRIVGERLSFMPVATDSWSEGMFVQLQPNVAP